MLIDEKTLEIPLFEDIIQSNADRIKPILDMDPLDEIISESVAGQLVENISKQEYEIFLSFQALISQINPLTATGYYLETMAKIRGIDRKQGESDEDLRKRLTGVKSVDDTKYKKFSLLETQLQNISDVTYARVIYKDNKVYPIISGGSDSDIADVLHDYAPIGALVGNSTITKDCIEYNITRATQQALKIIITIDSSNDSCICSASDKSKIIDLVMQEACNYTAGSLVRDAHFKSMLGKYGYVVSDVKFEIPATGQLMLNATQPAPNTTPCDTLGDLEEYLNVACMNAPCDAISGKEILVPEWVIPVFCRNAIEVI